MTTDALVPARCSLAPLDTSRVLVMLRGGPFDQQDILVSMTEQESGVVIRGVDNYRLSVAVSTLALGPSLVRIFDWVDPLPRQVAVSMSKARRAVNRPPLRRLN